MKPFYATKSTTAKIETRDSRSIKREPDAYLQLRGKVVGLYLIRPEERAVIHLAATGGADL